MVLKFSGGKTSRAYSSQFNNIAFLGTNGILSGLEVTENTIPDLDLLVAEGRYFFGNDVKDVSSTTVSVNPNVTSNDRIDLVLLSSAGSASVLQGTPNALPVPADYDPELFTVLAQILVTSNISAITLNEILDLRIISSGVVGSGSGSFGRRVELFAVQTIVTVQHNLNDDEPFVTAYDNSGNELDGDVTVLDANSLEVDFGSDKSGRVVVIGGTGVNNGYYSEDFTSQTTVNVTHSLKNKYVVVKVYDGTDVEIIPDTNTVVDEDNLTVTFLASTSGRIVVIGGNIIQTTSAILPEADYTLGETLTIGDPVSLDLATNKLKLCYGGLKSDVSGIDAIANTQIGGNDHHWFKNGSGTLLRYYDKDNITSTASINIIGTGLANVGDGDDVFIIDDTNNLVRKFTWNGSVYNAGNTGASSSSSPECLSVSPNYVAMGDDGDKKVRLFNRSDMTTVWTSLALVSNADFITIDEDGGYVYVGANNTANVVVLDISNGTLLQTLVCLDGNRTISYDDINLYASGDNLVYWTKGTWVKENDIDLPIGASITSQIAVGKVVYIAYQTTSTRNVREYYDLYAYDITDGTLLMHEKIVPGVLGAFDYKVDFALIVNQNNMPYYKGSLCLFTTLTASTYAICPVNLDLLNFVGILQESGVEDDVKSVIMPTGIDNNQTGLVTGKNVYTDINGDITQSPQPTEAIIGQAISDTQMIITK